MPTVSNGTRSLYYSVAGAGNGTDTVVFVSEAGLGGWSWGWQYDALTGPYETIVWDLYGTGRSGTPDDSSQAITAFLTDLETVLDAGANRRVHLVGAGFGGALSLLAARTSSRVRSLTLCGTPPTADAIDFGPLTVPPDDPAAQDRSLEALFSPAFRSAQPDVIAGIREWRASGDASLEGVRAQQAALSGFDATDWLFEVTQPTLVCHGTADTLVSFEAGRQLAKGLPRGELVACEGAGHLPQIEQSRLVNDRLAGFLEQQCIDE